MSWNKVNQVRKWCKGRKLSVTRRLFFIEIQLLDFEDVLFAMDFLHLRKKQVQKLQGVIINPYYELCKIIDGG